MTYENSILQEAQEAVDTNNVQLLRTLIVDESVYDHYSFSYGYLSKPAIERLNSACKNCDRYLLKFFMEIKDPVCMKYIYKHIYRYVQRFDNYDLVELLFELNFDFNDTNFENLKYACERGSVDIIQLCIKNGMHATQESLLVAFVKRRVDVVTILLDNFSFQYNVVFHTLIESGAYSSVDLIRLLIKKYTLTKKHIKELLFISSRGGYTDVLKLLIDSFEIPQYIVDMALYEASSSFESIKVLIENFSFSEDVLCNVLWQTAAIHNNDTATKFLLSKFDFSNHFLEMVISYCKEDIDCTYENFKKTIKVLLDQISTN